MSRVYVLSNAVEQTFATAAATAVPGNTLTVGVELPTRPKININKNLSALRRGTLEETVDSLTTAIGELQQLVEILAQRMVRASVVEVDGHPSHGQVSQLLDGQYLRVVSRGPGLPITLAHSLGRMPQGMLWFRNGSRTAEASLILEGDSQIPKTTDKHIHPVCQGPAGSYSIGVLI